MAVDGRLNAGHVHGGDFDRAAVAALRAAGDADQRTRRVGEIAAGLDRDIAAAAGAGIAIRANHGVRAEIHAVAGHQLDDAVVFLDRIGLHETLLIYSLGAGENVAAVGDEASI